ncbi:RecX family transcriptional regulator [Flavobacteriaceae bacterium F89]|uniref:Regulatory protein RecX n=1 Tax=Cerina litoralis TaxID=2874477 RepID=A0AAE3ESK0_9FLAO|nr:regulatory protein RecX [Cerina litoralis]MCG2460178.1 RecX family transcriptional regulator [Cerina litoralis]
MYSKQGHTLTEATKKLEDYCTYRERCHKEVTNKLRDMGMIPEAIDHIIVHLIGQDYLNEERFAKSFARGKFKIKKWGRVRIVNELKYRDISKYNIQIALEEIGEEDYVSTLESLAQKRLRSLKEPNLQKRRKKLANYLLYRGWESNLVYEKIKELIP